MAYNTGPGAIIRIGVDGVAGSRRQINSVGDSMTQLANTARNAFGSIAAAIGVGAGVSGLVRMADEYAKFTAQLALASSSTREYAAAYADVTRIANSSQQSLAATGVLYARIANGTRELGVSQAQVAKITETVNLALRVSGATAAESASAQLQLSQAFAGGALRGEEFNAVNEAAPRLLKALADGMGLPVGALRQMASDGLITSKIMADVLPKALEQVREEAARIQTVSGAFEELKNNMLIFVGTSAQTSGAASMMTTAIGLLADNLTLLAGAMATLVTATIGSVLASWVTGTYRAVTANAALRVSTLANAVATTGAAATISAAKLVEMRADTAAAATSATLAAARVVELRAAVLAAQGAVALAIATNGLIPAQARALAMSEALSIARASEAVTANAATTAALASTAALNAQATAATFAARAMGVLRGVMGFFGGPIGLIITLLGAAATAWLVWGRTAKSANDMAKESAVETADTIIKGLDTQIERHRTIINLRAQGMTAEQANAIDMKPRAALGALGNDLTALNEGSGVYASMSSDDRFFAREKILQKILELTTKINLEESTGIESKAITRDDELKKWFDANGSGAQKMTAELDALRKQFGTLPPEMEKLVRAKYVDKSDAAAIKSEATAYTSLITTIGEKIAAGKLEAAGYDQLSEAQKLTIKLDESIGSGKSKLSDAHVDEARALIAIVEAQDLVNVARKFDIEQVEARLAAAGALIQSAQDEADRNVELVKTFGLSKAAIEGMELARLREQLAQADSSKGYTAEIANLEELIYQRERSVAALDQLDGLEAAKKANDDKLAGQVRMWESIDQTARDTFVSIFDAGKSTFDRLRDTLKNGLLDLLYQMTIRKWIFNIGASVSGAGFAGAAQAAGTGGGIADGMNIMQAANGAYNAITSGFASIGTSVANGVQAGMNAAQGYSYAAGVSTNSAAATMAGTAATYAAGIAAGKLIGSAISGEYEAFGSGNAVVNVGLVAGAIVGGPIGAAIGGAIGGLINRAFGMGPKNVTSRGIEGNLGENGFSGNTYSNWNQSGGWFRSDRGGTDRGQVDAETIASFGAGYQALQGVSTSFAAALGLNADAIATRTQALNIALTDSAEENAAAVTKFFVDVGDTMATELAPNIAEFSKAGEASSATLQRLSGSITTANAWLSILRQRLFQVSLAGGDAADKLADAFGGLENLTASSKAFYELFYSEGERAARSQKDMAWALASVNLAMPETMMGLRSLAGSLDLNTEAGRAAYATLLTIAPEFAAVADLTAKMAQETAEQLIVAFTGNGKLTPALDATMLKVGSLSDVMTTASDVAGSISTIFLDAQSTLLNFNATGGAVRPIFTGAQLSAMALNSEIDGLRINSSATIIDIAGLSKALENVNTETFVATVGMVFSNLADRISGVIGDIGTERIALRDAALQIINPTVMSRNAIYAAMGEINTALPSNGALANAASTLQSSDARAVAAARASEAAQNALQSASSSSAQLAQEIASARASSIALDASAVTIYRDSNYGGSSGTMGVGNNGVQGVGNDALSSIRVASGYLATLFRDGNFNGGSVGYTSDSAGVGGMNDETSSIRVSKISDNIYDIAARNASAALTAATQNLSVAQANASSTAAELAAANNSYTAAAANAKAQQLAYAGALQNFALDAGKSVSKLSRLREETVKYYDTQKQLADLMSSSASGLRTTVADYRYSQMTDAQQFASLQASYATAYSMALSTDGEALAGYGSTLNNALNPLLERAQSVLSGSEYATFAATAIARAESIALRLETLTPTDYAADSLLMLGQIDATLAALDASSKSAERIIADAIGAGSDRTANGLRAVIAALAGQNVPAFAMGGSHSGGLRLVGESGPELEVTGPSRIYNAAQTRNIMSGSAGNTARLESLVAQQNQELMSMRIELRAIASSNSKMERLADRVYFEGALVRTDADTPLSTVAA